MDNGREIKLDLSLLWKEWWLHRSAHLMLVCILALGFFFYGFYGAWSEEAARPRGVKIDALRLPAGLVIRVPGWTSNLSVPPFDVRRAVPSYLEHHVDHRSSAIETPVTSSEGRMKLFGMKPEELPLLNNWEMVEGALPTETGTVVLPSELSSRYRVGDSVQVFFQDMYLNDSWNGSLRVTGFYESSTPLVQELVCSHETARTITGYSRSNVHLLWDKYASEFEAPQTYTSWQQSKEFSVATIVEDGLSPARAPVLAADEDVPSEARGKVLPFNLLLNDDIRYPTHEMPTLLRQYSGLLWDVMSAVMLMFLLLAAAITVVIVIIVIDHQDSLGTYKILGFEEHHVRYLYGAQLLIDGLLASLAGFLLMAGLFPVLGDRFGYVFQLPFLTLVLWSLGVMGFVLWGARSAGVLFATSQISNLLDKNAKFDWWALIRM